MYKKKNNFTKCILQQYENFKCSNLTKSHISNLKNKNTFTITTGHQLCFFTGPLYFFYKILDTINLCQILKKTHPNYNFIPVFWMASEDHDFEEINHFYFEKQKISFQTQHQNTPVGTLKIENLKPLFEKFSKLLGTGKNAKELEKIFQKSYLKNHNLSEATRVLIHHFFDEKGLLILDAQQKELKQLFTTQIENDCFKNNAFNCVSDTCEIKLKNYDIQVNPRKINFFYIHHQNETELFLKIMLTKF